MKRSTRIAILATLIGFAALGATQGYLASKRPQRSGLLNLEHLSAPVTVRYDDYGVPHIRAENEVDLYRALGYVHAQDRLFQMEMVRRLARGELSEVIGPALVDTDRLFRVLGIRAWAEKVTPTLDPEQPAHRALTAYLDGVNQYQNTRPAPLEFDVLGIPKRPFTVADAMAVSGYLAYSFAAAFKTEPVLTYVRDQLGPDYLRPFDTSWKPNGVVRNDQTALAHSDRTAAAVASLSPETWRGLAQLAQLSNDAISAAGLAQLEGSNAWAIAGGRTASGKPILAGDPHIAYALPSVWYEAHLSAPGFELYGHHTALVPTALLGLNRQFAWSLTMFQNDDIDLVKEKLNPANPHQAWLDNPQGNGGHWVDIESIEEDIVVKGAAPVRITLRRGPHGPIINDAFPLLGATNTQPIALWWALYESEPRLLDAMYALNRADTLAKARTAASLIHAPGLNVIWANAAGDIGWWAAAKLPVRPVGVDPAFMLDAGKGEARKPGWLPFSRNPQEENPARGYIVSANHQPAGTTVIPGYYSLPDRVRRLDSALADPQRKWTLADNQALQLATDTRYGPRLLATALPLIRPQLTDPAELALLDQLGRWQGNHPVNAIEPTLFNQMLYEFARVTMADELDADLFAAMLRVRLLDQALDHLLVDADSPWWDDRHTEAKETRDQRLLLAWQSTLAHLRAHLGPDPSAWTWGRAHTVTHGHPLGMRKPLDRIFNAGPLPIPGGHETPDNNSHPIWPVPLAVTFGPSTRRVIDFAEPDRSVGINPVGQSGVWSDPHYNDQSQMHATGQYRMHRLSDADIAVHTTSTLELRPRP